MPFSLETRTVLDHIDQKIRTLIGSRFDEYRGQLSDPEAIRRLELAQNTVDLILDLIRIYREDSVTK